MISEKPSPQELRFAQAYCRLGGTNGTQAAIAAGYSTKGAAVVGHRLLRKSRVLQAIKDETERSLRAGIALGADVLVTLAKTAKSESVRMQAASALLDRGGLRLAHLTEHHHTIEDKRTDAEVLARIEQLTRELGLSARVIEGERLDPLPAIGYQKVETVPTTLEGEFLAAPVTDCGYSDETPELSQ